MNEFVILSRLTTGDKFIIPVRKIAIIQGNPTGSDVYVEGLNQWVQVKETAEEITNVLKQLFDW